MSHPKTKLSYFHTTPSFLLLHHHNNNITFLQFLLSITITTILITIFHNSIITTIHGQVNNFYPSSCSGQCVSLSDLQPFINESFCRDTLLEYQSLNQSLRVCISSNFTISSNFSTNSSNNYLNGNDGIVAHLSTFDLFNISNEYAKLQFLDPLYQQGLVKGDSDCSNAAHRYMCQHYFPLCDATSDSSTKIYNLCMSSCENYYIMCDSRELIEFRCLVENNEIGRIYSGVWKSFPNTGGLELLCTGGSESVTLSGYVLLMVLIILSFISIFL